MILGYPFIKLLKKQEDTEKLLPIFLKIRKTMEKTSKAATIKWFPKQTGEQY